MWLLMIQQQLRLLFNDSCKHLVADVSDHNSFAPREGYQVLARDLETLHGRWAISQQDNAIEIGLPVIDDIAQSPINTVRQRLAANKKLRNNTNKRQSRENEIRISEQQPSAQIHIRNATAKVQYDHPLASHAHLLFRELCYSPCSHIY